MHSEHERLSEQEKAMFLFSKKKHPEWTIQDWRDSRDKALKKANPLSPKASQIAGVVVVGNITPSDQREIKESFKEDDYNRC